MNKKLLTLAVAAAMAVPAIASAEAILYGKVNVSLDYIDVNQNATFFRPGDGTVGTGNIHSPHFDFPIAMGVYNNGKGGTATAVNLGSFTGIQPGTTNGTLTTANMERNKIAAYNQAVSYAVSQGKSAAAAKAAGDYQLSLFVDDPTKSATDPQRKAYLANLSQAQLEAFQSQGPLAGGNAMDSYIAAQTAQIKTNVAAGTLTQAAADAQLNRLAFLQQSATDAAFVAAAKTGFRAGTSYKGWGMDQSWQGPSDRIGVKGSEDLGNGLKAVYQVEIGVDITNAWRDNNLGNGNRANAFAMRNSFVGLAGDWGTIMLGRYDTPLKLSTARLDLFSDTLADYNNTIGFQDIRADNAVAYITPSLSGFQFAAAVVPAGGATTLGVYNDQNDGLASSYSLAATYKNGPFYGSVAYESLGSKNYDSQNTYYSALYDGMEAQNDNKVRVGLGLLDWNGFTLTGIYEDRSHILGAPTRADGNFFQVQAGYAFGNNMIKGMWGRADLSRCADPNDVGFRFTCMRSALGQAAVDNYGILVENKQKTAWALGYDYNFSKRTQAFLQYTQVMDKIDNADWSGFSLGMMHSF